ncbi:MAG TPA: hypothetical protein VGT05_00055 [Patescibacteria group bacterium]|nr:hypothetical protein [Patescibacteria group bacterium]
MKLTKIAGGILLIITIYNILYVILFHKDSYFSFNYWRGFPALEKIYISSQYVNKHPIGWIPDETVNAYAGGKYIQGTLPQLIAPDTPPLGRYFIGLSAVVFNNANEITLLSGILSLILLFLVGNQIFSNKLISLIPVAMVSSERIFLNQFIYTPLLDIMQLVALLGCFYFFNKALNARKSFFFFILVSICLGCFIAIKFFITGITILAAESIVLLLQGQKEKFYYLLATFPVSVFILLITYIRSFWYGYSIKSFLGIQKWIFLYHKSQLILPLSIWPLLLLNKWYVWYGNKPVISDSQWSITWPVITVLAIVTMVFYFLKKIPHKKTVEILFAWIACYMLFFSFGQISSRYFVILIPVLYVVALYGIVGFLKMYEYRN